MIRNFRTLRFSLVFTLVASIFSLPPNVVSTASAIENQHSLRQSRPESLSCHYSRGPVNTEAPIAVDRRDSPSFLVGSPGQRYALFGAGAIGCSPMREGQVFVRQKGSTNSIFAMSVTRDFPYTNTRYTDSIGFQFYSLAHYYIDTTLLPNGVYEYVWGGYKDEDGNSTGFSVYPITFIVDNQNSTTSTTSTTTTVPPADVPQVLADDLTLVVHRPNRSASAYYSAVVRCSNRCGKLPDVFAAKLCEVGTSYRSSTCISSASMSPNGSKKRVTKTSTTNMFFGTFGLNKAPTGKRYRVYLNIPAGRNHAPVEGKATVAWTRKTANPPTTTTIPAPTTTTLPGVPTTTTPTTTIAPSNQPVAVISDRVSGLSTAVVQGTNTSVGIDVTLSCTGKCTALPSWIYARLCKVGTSFFDASCTVSQAIVRPSGTQGSSYFGQLRMGLEPTGLKYQPYFSILATGVSGYVRIGGTSRLTWTK